MSSSKQKLELTWIGKENRPRVEPRILLEEPDKSCHAKHRITEDDLFDNRLIFGDNLLALKALEQELTGKVRCVFIDPPYNTGSAFEHFDELKKLSPRSHSVEKISYSFWDSRRQRAIGI